MPTNSRTRSSRSAGASPQMSARAAEQAKQIPVDARTHGRRNVALLSVAPNPGGARTYVELLSAELTRRDHYVDLITCQEGDPTAANAFEFSRIDDDLADLHQAQKLARVAGDGDENPIG